MQFSVVLALITTVSASVLSRDLPACPTAAGSACGIVTALGKTITYPSCNCQATCSGDVTFSGIKANVVSVLRACFYVCSALTWDIENRRKLSLRSTF